jgi:hypothetical protein
MHFRMLAPVIGMLLQTADDQVRDEIGRLQRNFQGLIWGFVAAWVILLGYILMLTMRERRIRREMDRLKSIVEETEKK